MTEFKTLHPRRRKWTLIGILAAVLILAAAFGYRAWTKARAPKIGYREAKVERSALQVTILSTGTVQPENRVQIKPPIAGRVEKVLVDEGYRVKKGQVLAWMSSTERAALLDAASARGPEELKRWEELYRSTPILAPINGSVIVRNVESGQTFTTNDAIFDLSDRLTVKAQVDETDIAQIKLKQKAVLVLDAYPGQRIAGHVDQIAYDAKTVNNVTTYIVDVLPESTPEFMRSGMTANVTFEVGAKQSTLLIPVEAVKLQNGSAYVLIPGTDNNSNNAPQQQRPIQTGLSDGKRIEVVSGLTEGEKILVPEYRATPTASSPSSPFSPFGHAPRK